MFFRKFKSALKIGPSSKDRSTLLEIERLARETGARAPKDRKHQKALVAPYRTSARYLSGIMDAIGTPEALHPEKWSTIAIWNALFSSPREIASALNSRPNLRRLFADGRPDPVYALLTATMQTKIVSGADEENGIVHRDVLQKNVYFENFQILFPSPDFDSVRNAFLHTSLKELFLQCRQEATDLASWKAALKEQRERIKFKIRSGPDAFARSNEGTAEDLEARQVLSDLDRKIEEIEKGIESPEGTLEQLKEMLAHPEQHLTVKTIRLKKGRMGNWMVSRGEGHEGIVTLTLLAFRTGHPEAAVWIRISPDALSWSK